MSPQDVSSNHANPAGIVDCLNYSRLCVTDSDCSLMCLPYHNVRFICGQNVCSVTPIENSSEEPDENQPNCNVKEGEFAIIVGLTDLGYISWRCVQLYPQYQLRDTFCEGGKFDMDARVREPSYRDCTCPPQSIRMIENFASFYDNAIPHCIPERNVFFYSENMKII